MTFRDKAIAAYCLGFLRLAAQGMSAHPPKCRRFAAQAGPPRDLGQGSHRGSWAEAIAAAATIP